MSEWRSVTVEDLALNHKSALATGPFGSAVASKNFRDSGVPMLRGGNLSDDVGVRLDERELVFLDPELAVTFGRSTARKHDLVFTCWGSVGQIGLIDGSAKFDEYVVSNKQMKLSPDPSKVDPLFLYYNMSQPKMIFEVQSRAIGSTIPGFNLGQLRALKVQIPELAEQRAIAAVLGALDDKIAANTKLANTAEELLSARWHELVHGGSCPIDWRPISSCGRVVTGKTPSTSVPSNYGGETPFVTVGDMRNGIFVGSTERALSSQGVTSVKGAVLPAGAVLMSCIATVGEVAVTSVTCVTNQQINALVPNDDLDPSFTSFSFRALGAELKGMGSGGSVYTNVSKSKFGSMSIPVPALAIQKRVVSQLDRLSQSARTESRVLAEIRDALLPRLMSGRLRVKDLEKVLENAGV